MTNYASLFEIESLAAAIVFVVLYVPFFVYFFAKAIARPNYVYIIITFFCAGPSLVLSISRAHPLQCASPRLSSVPCSPASRPMQKV